MTMNNDSFADELEELKISYLSTLGETLDEIENMFLQLTKVEQVEGEELFRFILRELHSVKGTAGSFGVHFISKACHNCEDYLQEQEKVFPLKVEVEEVLLKFIDLVRSYCTQTLEQTAPDESALGKALHEIFRDDDKVLKILIVDPGKAYFKAYKAVLKDINCQLYYTSSGFAAFERLLNIPHDYVVFSKFLDGIDGMELLGCINSVKSRLGNLKTVLVSTQNVDNNISHLKPDFFLIKDKNLAKSLLDVVKGSL